MPFSIFIEKKTFSLRSDIAVVGILIVLLLIQFVGAEETVRRLAEQTLRPFLLSGKAITYLVELPFRTLVRARTAEVTLRELESKYALSLAEVSALEGVKAENEALRGLLLDRDRTADQVLIVRPIFSQSRAAIDVGSQQGVTVGMAVLVDRTVVGLVAETSTYYSLVTPLAELTQQAVLATTEKGQQGLIKGDKRDILLTEVPSDAAIEVGEKIVTLGQPGIARDLFVGTISREIVEPESPTKKYIIEQPVSFNEARVAELFIESP